MQSARPLPWRLRWQKNRDPWDVWVSEIMLQQTVIKAVLPLYERFLTQFPSPKSLAEADPEAIRLAVRGLGYYRRFDFLQRGARFVTEDLKNVWPSDYATWRKVPGIGDYTASAIASITRNLPHGVVDGNVERVLCRLYDIRTAPNLPDLKIQFKKIMDQLVSYGSPGIINQAVMELGQTICTPAAPKCPHCPVQKACLAFTRGTQHLAPAAKVRQSAKSIDMILLIPYQVTREGLQIGTYRRPPTAKFLKATLGFLTLIRNDQGVYEGDGFHAPLALAKTLQRKSKSTTNFIRHSITNHKITAKVVYTDALRSLPEPDQFVGASRLEEQLVSNLDRKAWHKVL